MKRIPNIDLTKEECENIQNSSIIRGGEGIVCPSGKANTLYKIFLNPKQNVYFMSENKQRKISELYQKSLPYLVSPIATISYNGEIIGYEMSFDPFDQSLEKLASIDRKYLIEVLRKSKTALEYFASQDITYGDVTADNLLVNIKTGNITFCDIDNMRVGINGIDVKGFSLMRYYEMTGTIDAKADAYMHNLLTIKKLSSPDKYESEILKDLKSGIYPTKFKLGARPIFKSMTIPETFSGEYVIQYIKR